MIAQLSKNLLTLEEQTQLVQGSVGETVRLKRSEDWKRMAATAVFSNGEQTRDVIVSGETLVIPWELLQEEGRRLTLNFHGADDSGCVVQTNIASLGRVKKSNSPSGIPPEAPTPARADQIQALAQEAMAVAADLQASAASGAFDGVSPQVSVQAADGGHTVSITDRSGTHSFTVLDGDAGGSVTIDPELSSTSENPVQNRVIKAALDSKANASDIPAVDDKLLTFSENPLQNKVITRIYSELRAADARLSFVEYNEWDIFALEMAALDPKTLIFCLFDGSLYQMISHQERIDDSTPETFIFGGFDGSRYVKITCVDERDNASGSWSLRYSYIPVPATTDPVMDGTAAVGSSAAYARADHVHPSDSSKADKVTALTVSTSGDVTQSLDAGTIYHFTGALTALTITLNPPAGGDLAQYHFDFLSDSTAPTLTLPNTVTMPDSFTIDANKRYEVDILNNYGAVISWPN